LAEVILSEKAKADLDTIDRFGIDNFGAPVAADYMRGFHDIFARLAAYPMSGQEVAKLKPTVRRLSYRSHHLFYTFRGDTVRIVRILHHAMNAAPHLRQ
jgi:toxin ParE1/3/4